MITIYVGNIAYSMQAEELENLFKEYGTVATSKIITYKDTGRSKGFGFVEMENEEEANNAINELNGKEIQGRSLKVDKAHTRKES